MISEQHAREYCYEEISLIENYSKAIADTTQTWVCHHRAEILPCGRYSRAQLKRQGLLKHVPASQLIFLTRKEHRRLHMQGNTYQLGKHLSAKAKAKISAANKGKNHPFFGKHHSEEAKAKMAAALKGKITWMKGKHHSEEAKTKMSESHKGQHHSVEAKVKIAEAIKKRWQKWRESHGRV